MLAGAVHVRTVRKRPTEVYDAAMALQAAGMRSLEGAL